MSDTPLPSIPPMTPEQQQAWDDARAQPGVLLDDDGNVIFDGEAEAMGAVPFKTRAEMDAQEAHIQELLAARRIERAAEQAAAEAEGREWVPPD
jgi:hypothetical protein